MEVVTIILLLILGVVLLLVEFLLIPGISIAGIGCFISFGIAVYFAFKYWGSLAGFAILLSILIIVPFFLYYLFKSRAVKPMMLDAKIDGKVKTVDEQHIKTGDIGVAIGRLAPTGKAKINGNTVEARTQGIFVDPKTKIEVLKIEGNTVIVKPINE